MPALVIDLDDRASDGIDVISQHLSDMAPAAQTAAGGLDLLSQAQSRNITIIQKQTVGFGKLADTSISTFGTMASTALKAASDIEVAATRWSQAVITTSIRSGASLAKTAVAGVAAVKGLEAVFGKQKQTLEETAVALEETSERHKEMAETSTVMASAIREWDSQQQKALATTKKTAKSISESGDEHRRWGVAVATGMAVAAGAASQTAAGHKLLETAVTKAGLSFLGLAPQALGAKIALTGFEAVLARTGKHFEEISDGTYVMVTNLDRAEKAFHKFGGSVQRDLQEGGAAVFDLVSELGRLETWSAMVPDQIKETWKSTWDDIDMRATRSTDNLVVNVTAMNKLWDDGVMSLRAWANAYAGGPGGDIFKQQLMREREMNDSRGQLWEALDRQELGMRRVAKANEQLEGSARKRGISERIASLDSVAAVNAEIQALKERRAADAVAGNLSNQRIDLKANPKVSKEEYLDSVAAEEKSLKLVKEYTEQLEALELRRTAIGKEAASQRKQELAAEAKALEDAAKAEAKRQEEQVKRVNELMALDQKRVQSLRGLRVEIAAESQRTFSDVNAAIRGEQHGAAKDSVSEQMKARGATEGEIKAQLSVMDKKFADQEHQQKLGQINAETLAKLKAIDSERIHAQQEITDEFERAKALRKLRDDEDKVRAEQQKRVIAENGRFAIEQTKIEVDAKRAAEKAKFDAEKERLDKVKQLQQQAMQKFDAQSVLDSADPMKVLRQLQDNRAQQFAQQQAAKDADLQARGMAGDQRAARKFLANQQRAMARGRQTAMNDFENGNVDVGELTKAQGQLANQTIATMTQQGQLNLDFAKSATDAVNALSQQQQSIAQVQRMMADIQAVQKGQKTQAKQTLNAAQAQLGGLGGP